MQVAYLFSESAISDTPKSLKNMQAVEPSSYLEKTQLERAD